MVDYFATLPSELIELIVDEIPVWMDLILFHIKYFREIVRENVELGLARPRLLEQIICKDKHPIGEYFFQMNNLMSDCCFAFQTSCTKLVHHILSLKKFSMYQLNYIAELSIIYNDINIFDRLLDNELKDHQKNNVYKWVIEAAKCDNYEILEYLSEKWALTINRIGFENLSIYKHVLCLAMKYRNWAAFMFIAGKYYCKSKNISIVYDSLSITLEDKYYFVAWMIADKLFDSVLCHIHDTNKCIIHINKLLKIVCSFDNKLIFMYLYNKYSQYILDYQPLYKAAAFSGTYPIFIYIYANECIKPDPICANFAALSGNIHVLILLRMLGIKCDMEDFTDCNEEVLKFLKNTETF
jgi:hypothetical protein